MKTLSDDMQYVVHFSSNVFHVLESAAFSWVLLEFVLFRIFFSYVCSHSRPCPFPALCTMFARVDGWRCTDCDVLGRLGVRFR